MRLRLVRTVRTEAAEVRRRARQATADEADRLRAVNVTQLEAIYALEEEVTRLRAKVKAYESERERIREELS